MQAILDSSDGDLARAVRALQPGSAEAAESPAALVQDMPSMRLDITLTSTGTSPIEIGRYALEHSSSVAPSDDVARRAPKRS